MSSKSKVTMFFKKNFYYVLLGLCLAAVATIVTLAVVLDKDNPPLLPDDPIIEDPVNTDPLPFFAPLGDAEYTFGHEYTGEDGFIFSAVNGQYEAHFGIDFIVDAGTSVYSAHDGTVLSVTDDKTDGLVIMIEHADNVITCYKALNPDDVRVEAGQAVERGQVIGTVAQSTLYELDQGAHLHFEIIDKETMLEVDPLDYYPDMVK